MLPDIIDLNAAGYTVKVGKSGGRLFLLFVDRAGSNKQSSRPHYVRECADRATLAALERWFALRRDLWQEWGRLAEKVGADAFREHMDALLAAEPPPFVAGTVAMPLDDPHEIAFGEVLQEGTNSRVEVVRVHRFASEDVRRRFLQMREAGDFSQLGLKLLEIGWREGGVAVSRTLDDIAAGSGEHISQRRQ